MVIKSRLKYMYIENSLSRNIQQSLKSGDLLYRFLQSIDGWMENTYNYIRNKNAVTTVFSSLLCTSIVAEKHKLFLLPLNGL